MRRLAHSDDARDGIELFAALWEYRQQLCGPSDRDRMSSAGRSARVTAMIARIRAESVTEPAVQHDQQDVRRVDQPVNAAVTVTQGRELADRLVGTDDWQAELGAALNQLYDQLDRLHGGSFTELLNSTERRRVAAAVADSGIASLPP